MAKSDIDETRLIDLRIPGSIYSNTFSIDHFMSNQLINGLYNVHDLKTILESGVRYIEIHYGVKDG